MIGKVCLTVVVVSDHPKILQLASVSVPTRLSRPPSNLFYAHSLATLVLQRGLIMGQIVSISADLVNTTQSRGALNGTTDLQLFPSYTLGCLTGSMDPWSNWMSYGALCVVARGRPADAGHQTIDGSRKFSACGFCDGVPHG
jgi:hypothetical protein